MVQYVALKLSTKISSTLLAIALSVVFVFSAPLSLLTTDLDEQKVKADTTQVDEKEGDLDVVDVDQTDTQEKPTRIFEEEDEPEDEGSVISFNFIYYILSKFKFPDLFKK